jgi:hypothetical protein
VGADVLEHDHGLPADQERERGQEPLEAIRRQRVPQGRERPLDPLDASVAAPGRRALRAQRRGADGQPDDRPAELLRLGEALLHGADERLDPLGRIAARLEAWLEVAACRIERGAGQQVLERREVEVDGSARDICGLGDLGDRRVLAARRSSTAASRIAWGAETRSGSARSAMIPR